MSTDIWIPAPKIAGRTDGLITADLVLPAGRDPERMRLNGRLLSAIVALGGLEGIDASSYNGPERAFDYSHGLPLGDEADAVEFKISDRDSTRNTNNVRNGRLQIGVNNGNFTSSTEAGDQYNSDKIARFYDNSIKIGLLQGIWTHNVTDAWKDGRAEGGMPWNLKTAAEGGIYGIAILQGGAGHTENFKLYLAELALLRAGFWAKEAYQFGVSNTVPDLVNCARPLRALAASVMLVPGIVKIDS